jgi:hypothetical protein
MFLVRRDLGNARQPGPMCRVAKQFPEDPHGSEVFSVGKALLAGIAWLRLVCHVFLLAH